MQQMMRSMEMVPFLFITGFLLVAAGIIIFAGLHARRRAGLIRAMPTSNIGMAQDGYCEFEGMIEPIGGAQMIAPLTLTPCAWYNAKLEKWSRGTNSSGSWTTVREATSSAPLMLRDATGVCLVFPYLAEITPTDKSQWTGGTAVPAERNPPRFGPGGSSTPAFQVSGGPNSRFRYTEERIYVGDPLFVLGEFSSRQFEPDDEDEDDAEQFDDDPIDEGEERTAESSREAVDEEEEEEHDDGADDPGDWNDSRSEELTALAEQTTRACVQKGSSGKPFIMSTTPQAAHVYMSEVGGQVALYFAALPLGLMALLLYARYG